MPITINGEHLFHYTQRRGTKPPKVANKLPIEAYEEVLQLQEKYCNKEIAIMLGITKDGVQARAWRARKILGR